MPSIRGAVLPQPATLGIGKAPAEQRVFAGEAGALQAAEGRVEEARRRVAPGAGGHLARDGDDEAELVLQVRGFGPVHEPVPVEIGVAKRDPRKCFDKARIQVVALQGKEQGLRRVTRTGAVADSA